MVLWCVLISANIMHELMRQNPIQSCSDEILYSSLARCSSIAANTDYIFVRMFLTPSHVAFGIEQFPISYKFGYYGTDILLEGALFISLDSVRKLQAGLDSATWIELWFETDKLFQSGHFIPRSLLPNPIQAALRGFSNTCQGRTLGGWTRARVPSPYGMEAHMATSPWAKGRSKHTWWPLQRWQWLFGGLVGFLRRWESP